MDTRTSIDMLLSSSTTTKTIGTGDALGTYALGTASKQVVYQKSTNPCWVRYSINLLLEWRRQLSYTRVLEPRDGSKSGDHGANIGGN